MRGSLLAALAASGCTQILGIDDPPPEDPCVDTCECKVDDECGLHEACEDLLTSRTCECAAGYVVGANGCTFAGVIADPGFADATKWTPQLGAVLDPIAGGFLDPGFAKLPRGSCGMAVIQPVQMPRAARAEPLVAETSYRMISGGIGDERPAFGIGDTWTDGPQVGFASTLTTIRTCLGPGHFAPAGSTGLGAVVPLGVGKALTGACTEGEIELDHFEIVPALPGECPDFGQVTNGRAEQDDGWTLTASANATAMFVAGIGEAGTRAVELRVRESCDAANAQVPASIPTGSPALSMFVSTAAGTILASSLDRQHSQDLAANQTRVERACVPAELRGTVTTVELFAQAPLVTGVCGEAADARAVIDSVELADDSSCGADPAIANPRFDSATLLDRFASDTGVVEVAGGELRLAAASCNASASWATKVITPRPTGEAGPALKFTYRNGAGTQTTLRVSRAGASAMLPRTANPTEGILCLDPELAGRAQSISFALDRNCAGVFPLEETLVDDLVVTVDPQCGEGDGVHFRNL